MAELKTQRNTASVTDFLNSIEDEKRREDSFTVLEMMKEVTREEPEMWGANIVGFGNYSYKYATGREGVWFKMGFSPRKGNLTLYIMPGLGAAKTPLQRSASTRPEKGVSTSTSSRTSI